jgi:hypothetical protein
LKSHSSYCQLPFVQNALVAGGIKANNPYLAGRKYGPLLKNGDSKQ